MHVELIQSLRCLASHEESWLVATVDRQVGRHVADGSLGCPICHRRYPIRDFVADFAQGAAQRSDRDPHPTDEGVLRTAALLDLRTPGGIVVLAGDHGALAAALAASFDVQCLVVNPPSGVTPGDGLSLVLLQDRLPLAEGAARGAAVDREQVSLLPSLARTIRPAGRVVAPAHAPMPGELRELVRDDSEWVAERVVIGGVIPLRRGS
jgi:hypothetical protein